MDDAIVLRIQNSGNVGLVRTNFKFSYESNQKVFGTLKVSLSLEFYATRSVDQEDQIESLT